MNTVVRSDPSRGGRRRRLAIPVLFAAVLGAQGFALVRGLHDPHKVFAFRMFSEASTWKAEIVRVTSDGRRVPVGEHWPGGYSWSTLVRGRGLGAPARSHHADASLAATINFLGHALDWVAKHTPADTETDHLEAVVTYSRNLGPTQVTILRSQVREGFTGHPSVVRRVPAAK